LNPRPLEQAARAILAGGIVAYPTEGCYGLGCDPRRPNAVRRLLRLKRRSYRPGLIVIAARLGQLLPYTDITNEALLAAARASWPGPLTWLVPARPGVPAGIRGAHATVAVRVTAHPVAAALCRHARRAITSTSANRSGQLPLRTAAAVRREFGEAVDVVLNGALGDTMRPTPIRDLLNGALVRPG
jgi:L-threonylcarbamoyladenylate synthase